MQFQVDTEIWPLKGVFRIARGARTHAQVVTIRLADKGCVGRGECVPYARYQEDCESVVAQLEAVRAEIEAGITLEDCQDLLPPGAARNALDCALWDLRAKSEGRPVWELAGLPQPKPVVTAFTISLDTPEAMTNAALAAKGRPILKVKIGGDHDLDCVRAVAKARPDARLIVDANEGMAPDTLPGLLSEARSLHIDVVEQPFAARKDSKLGQMAAPIAICADESFHTSADIEHLVQNYDAVNVKLDKTGGFTEALKSIREAKAAGLRVMMGCMVGTSLVTAPAVLLAQLVDWVDLDGPLLLDKDREPGLVYEGSILHPPAPDLWG
ncbi:L-Ala-D/L-Glu epimerase [Candidatus Phycosocius bacilliformis]|uniref:Dipeptide epimerase n=1 Tax=Candidatus Phycosocius bacilliformis TaxID=1445552 RepID=A0A2P2EAU5_9PROT|nr:N-acetyl-D-Glu racemase DgcA [Candidatus Phycosocius bacilliformis]GBF58163.1 L-Ala-D/L-Glu epimerase [Candidatus Phycosocius bacilliformis]